MSETYQRIMVAVDGSYESELAVEKAINVALRNKATLLLVHVIDTNAYRGEFLMSDYDFNEQIKHSDEVLSQYASIAREKGLSDIKCITEIGNPNVLLAKDIPQKEKADLIMVGATGMNTFERLLVGSTSEYLLRHSQLDVLVVRDGKKTF